MKKTNLFAVLALAATPAFLHAQTTNFSDIVGYTTLNVRAKSGSANALSFIALNVHRPTAYKGAISAKSLNGSSQTVLSFSSPGFTANQFSSAGSKHYIRVTSTNANTGLISEIVANDASSITVADNLDAVIDAGVTTVEVRPYWTLGTAFPSGAGLTGGTSATPADTVTIVDPVGSSLTYFYNTSVSKWRRGVTDSDNVILPPGSGILITRKQTSAVSIQIAGEVIKETIQTDILGGTSSAARMTFVSNPYPLSSKTLSQSGLYTGNQNTGLVGGTAATTADNLTIYDPSNGAANTYYYNTTNNRWQRGITDSSSIVIPEGSAFVITRRANRPAFDWYIPSPVPANL